ncbi:hypothetical protein MAPG_00688 [Magnaporthiopsis poae ATCC 64411]|uniref:Myb-like DNA-binding domain-containing protein n=1 Tax=Magnaporthiopsis poae (strain ATCC 64411 / 73-15) TaxID=644358 RepID=A0A0C4DLP3_MAGP6|nr:hypothetical protein MAPG_00688 [Magnaporthiopsis poae ATCC 64411]
MPPKKTSDESVGASKRATDNDLRFFESYLKHMNSVPDVSWDAVAADMGLAHGGSARERFRQIKQKLGWAGPSATPRGNKRKNAAAAAAAAEGAEDSESLEPETPTKRPKNKAAGSGPGRKKKNQAPAGDAVKDEDANGASNDNNNEQREESIDNVMAGEA